MASDSDLNLLSYTFAAHTLAHSLLLTIPIFIPLWLVEFSVTRYEVGLAVTLMVGLYGVMGVPAGILSDRYGSDTLITLYLAGTGVATLLPLASTGFTSVAVALGVIGASAGFYHSPALSLISRQASSPAKAFAYHGMGANVGIGVGPLIVAVALAYASWETILAAYSVPLLLGAVLFHLRGPTDETYGTAADGGETRSLRADVGTLATLAFGLVLVMYAFKGVYYRGTLTFLPDFLDLSSGVSPLSLFGKEIPASRWVYSAILLVGSVGQIVGGHLGDRFGAEPTLLVTYLVTGGVLFVVGGLSGGALLVAGVAFGLLLFIAAPLTQNLIATYTPGASRGMGFGVIFGFNHGVGAAGAAIAGWLATYSTYEVAFRVLAVGTLGAFLAVLGLRAFASERRGEPGDPDPSPAD